MTSDFVDLFSGAGLVAEALKQAGLRLRVAADNWPLAIRTFTARHGDRCAHCNLLQPGAIPGFLKRNGIKPSFHGLIHMSPPCTEFSVARGGFEASESNELAFDAIADVAEYAPHALIMVENVTGFLSSKYAYPRLQMSKRIYACRKQNVDDDYMMACVYSATMMGVPQTRDRMIFPISPRGARMPLPCSCKINLRNLTIRKAIGGRFSDPDPEKVELTSRERELFEGMPPGGNWRSTLRARKHAMSKRGPRPPECFLHRNGWDDIPPCVIASPRAWLKDGKFLHPGTGELRRFTLGELRAFQAIPRDYVFSGEKLDRLRQIGNAVPPPMAIEAAMTAIAGLR